MKDGLNGNWVAWIGHTWRLVNVSSATKVRRTKESRERENQKSNPHFSANKFKTIFVL
jgi:hypothetical protein